MKLKPCPFCGEKAKLIEDSDHHGDYFTLGCSYCECIAHDIVYTESEYPAKSAVDSWNHRPIEDELQAELKDAVEKRSAEHEKNSKLQAEITRLKDAYTQLSQTADALKSEADEARREIERMKNYTFPRKAVSALIELAKKTGLEGRRALAEFDKERTVTL